MAHAYRVIAQHPDGQISVHEANSATPWHAMVAVAKSLMNLDVCILCAVKSRGPVTLADEIGTPVHVSQLNRDDRDDEPA